MSVIVSCWKQLADLLITTDELDPVYPFTVRLGEKEGFKFQARFLMAFFLFYDLGGAIEAASRTEDNDFWDYIKVNYDKMPRGRERRHSRGALGRQFVDNLSSKGTPTSLWGQMYQPTYTKLVIHLGQRFTKCGIGPYFTWKLMDMYDRILGLPVRLNKSEADKWLPPEPREAIKLSGLTLSDVTAAIINYKAPGLPNRNCGYAEAETVLCAIKGLWYSRSYRIGDDLRRRHRELEYYPDYKVLLPPLMKDKYVPSHTLDTQRLPA